MIGCFYVNHLRLLNPDEDEDEDEDEDDLLDPDELLLLELEEDELDLELPHDDEGLEEDEVDFWVWALAVLDVPAPNLEFCEVVLPRSEFLFPDPHLLLSLLFAELLEL